MRIVLLAGGVGGSKLAQGFYRTVDPSELTFIVNTGDDIVMHGLHVSPDPDILIYTLAGAVNPETGWGLRDESFRAAEGLKAFGRPVWFHLGDRDLATHIHRTAAMREGATLSEAIDSIRRALGVNARVLPMSDDPVPTMIDTGEERLHLQDYFVRRRCEPRVSGIAFDGVEAARPAPGVLAAVGEAAFVVLAPSNPLISIGPILAVPGIREALRKRRRDVAAVCPLVGGKSLKGPSDKMMAELGYEASAFGVAQLYADFCGTFVIDEADADAKAKIEALHMTVAIRPTVMTSTEDKERLAREVLRLMSG